jgi:AraC family transcriptional regulator of adaptative response/methylated-DNA-[protein]-cysteine methyltransferase
MIYSTTIETPIGQMLACSSQKGICLLEFTNMKTINQDLRTISKTLDAEIVEESNSHLEILRHELTEFFTGRLKKFSSALHLTGTPFQQTVWEEVKKITFGTTVSYSNLADTLQNPLGIRAIAQVNARNKIYIVIPCHRVIASSGKLTGYGGGLWRKQFLLDLEMGQKCLAPK